MRRRRAPSTNAHGRPPGLPANKGGGLARHPEIGGVDGNKTVAAVAGAVPVSVSVSASVSWSWRTSWFPCVSPTRAVGWRVWDGACGMALPMGARAEHYRETVIPPQ